MAYDIECVKNSQKIFYRLLSDGMLDEETVPELYREYVENEEVMNLVKSQAEIAESVVERYGDTIYIMPAMGNTYLGFSKAELKKELCKSNGTDKDYYLSQFVILTLLVEFYDGQGSRCKSRDFIKMGELQNIISERLKNGMDNEDETEENRRDTGLDFHSMCQAYEALKSADATNRSKTTKEGFINNIMTFLDRQGIIIYILQDEMIKTTPKLDNIMEMKILNRENYQRIMEALNEQNKQS